ncbi:FAD binding domain-containing protein [Schizophyllum fasciatum]
MTATDVLVIGAGPSGLVTALCLAQNGARVRVVDKLATPCPGQKGSGIQPRTLELYKFLGLLDDFEKRAGTLQPFVHYKLPGGTEIAREFAMMPTEAATPSVPYPNARVLAQDRHEELLREHLQRFGVAVERATELLDFAQGEHGVRVRIARGGAVEALDVAFLVGADGGHSRVRKLLGLKFEGETRYMDKMVIGDIMVKPQGLDKEKWHSWGDMQSKEVRLRPAEAQDQYRLGVIVSGPEVDFEKVASSREEFVNFFYELSGRRDIQFGELVALNVFRPNIRMVDKFGEGRVFVVGDAAHTHSPTGGQGLNSCVQDAANLAWKMSLVLKNLAPPALLRTYTAERAPAIRDMLARTTRLLERTMRPRARGDPDAGWRRGGALYMLGIHCRWSRIVRDARRAAPAAGDERASAYAGAARGVCAGDRAPDAPVAGGAGRLFELFGVARHVALVFSADAARADAVAGLPAGLCAVAAVRPRGCGAGAGSGTKAEHVLEDRDGEAYKAYEVADDPTVVVVRPDGVIGAIVMGEGGVEEYFGGILA